jgi:acetyl/propionyl-CoA carboxylase alpha subunit
MKNHSQLNIDVNGHRFEFDGDGQDIEIAYDEGTRTYRIHEDGRSYEIRLIDFDLVSGQCRILIDGQPKEIRIFREIEVMIERMGLNAGHAKKLRGISAPMPGLVIRVEVKEGQHLEKGAPLVILEAMKMENVLTAPHDAVIKKVYVKTGQAVERGLMLIEFENQA